jgi:hypothetical protein
MSITLSVPSVIVNNETIAIVPNSFTYDGGEGEINVRAASGGGNTIESVHSVNAEGKIGGCKFDLYLTPDLDSKIRTWKGQVGQNNIQFVQRISGGGNVTRSLSRQSLINMVERNASSDGVVSLEFKGDPMAGV